MEKVAVANVWRWRKGASKETSRPEGEDSRANQDQQGNELEEEGKATESTKTSEETS